MTTQNARENDDEFVRLLVTEYNASEVNGRITSQYRDRLTADVEGSLRMGEKFQSNLTLPNLT